jgi:Zn-dependent M16 (insulinase) family peptidase
MRQIEKSQSTWLARIYEKCVLKNNKKRAQTKRIARTTTSSSEPITCFSNTDAVTQTHPSQPRRNAPEPQKSQQRATQVSTAPTLTTSY